MLKANNFGWLIVVSSILASVWFFYSGITLQNPQVYDENGSIENTQAIIISIAMFIYVYLAATRERYRVLFILAALLFFSFLIRELDIEQLDLPDWMRYWFGKEGKPYTLGMLWSAAILSFVKAYNRNIKLLKALLFSKSGVLMAISLVFLILADIVEKHIIKLPYYQFYEELFEFYAYMFMVVAAVMLLGNDQNDQSAGI